MIRVVLALSMLGLLAGRLGERHVWRQKTTVTVATPTGPVSGSAVVEVRARFFEDGELMTGREVH